MRHHPVFLASPTSVSHRFGEGTVIGVCQHRLDRSRLAAHLRQGETAPCECATSLPRWDKADPSQTTTCHHQQVLIVSQVDTQLRLRGLVARRYHRQVRRNLNRRRVSHASLLFVGSSHVIYVNLSVNRINVLNLYLIQKVLIVRDRVIHHVPVRTM